jgi:hypothetical protein
MANQGLNDRIALALMKRKSSRYQQARFVPNYAQAKRILLAYPSTVSPSELQDLERFSMDLETDRIKVIHAIYFNTKDKNQLPLVSKPNRHHWGRWDFDRFYFPLSEELIHLLRGDTFDMFISADMGDSLPIAAMGATVNAACKIGHYHKSYESFYNILIRGTAATNLNQYLRDVKTHIKNLG